MTERKTRRDAGVWLSAIGGMEQRLSEAEGYLRSLSGGPFTDMLREQVAAMRDQLEEMRRTFARMDAEEAREEREGVDNWFADKRPLVAKGAHAVYSGR